MGGASYSYHSTQVGFIAFLSFLLPKSPLGQGLEGAVLGGTLSAREQWIVAYLFLLFSFDTEDDNHGHLVPWATIQLPV